jgi:hypothetical protein
MQAAYNWNGNKPARFCVDLSPFLTQTVEGELTSNGHQLTSQGGSVAEEGRDKDQCIKNDLLPYSQKFEELPTEILDRSLRLPQNYAPQDHRVDKSSRYGLLGFRVSRRSLAPSLQPPPVNWHPTASS